jgi:feruloyl esterase
MTLPAFCRIEAVARPTSDSEIVRVWILPAEAWNGKFQGVGNGGTGRTGYAAMATALRCGYATASTDTGHAGDDMKFGQAILKIIDWAYRSIHVMTDASKLIVRNHTGRLAERSYFVGCSSGGHQALSEAQRYPEDYDGIVAGRQPGSARRSGSCTVGSDAWQGRSPILPPRAADSLKGGRSVRQPRLRTDHDDPRRCTFDPQVVVQVPFDRLRAGFFERLRSGICG